MEISAELFQTLLDNLTDLTSRLIRGEAPPLRREEMQFLAGAAKTITRDNGFIDLYIDNTMNLTSCLVTLDSNMTSFIVPPQGGLYIPVEVIQTVTCSNNVWGLGLNRSISESPPNGMGTVTAINGTFVTVPMTQAAANVAVSLGQTGVPGKSWYLGYFNWRVAGTAPVGATDCVLTILDGATVIYEPVIAAAAPVGTNNSIIFAYPLKITTGNAFTYAITTPGNPGCIIYANLGCYNQ